MYCDRDSVIYIQPNDEPDVIETGDKLGGMNSELGPTTNSSRICEWLAKELRVHGCDRDCRKNNI